LLASGPPPPAEKRLAKEAALAKKEEPFRLPLDHLEHALSLATTILWTWHWQAGAELVLAVADVRLGIHIVDNGGAPVETLLEYVAQVAGGPHMDTEALVRAVAAYPLPAGPILLITTHASGLADRLAAALGQHVSELDVSQPPSRDLFDMSTDMRLTHAQENQA
jgi:hypothetical protein